MTGPPLSAPTGSVDIKPAPSTLSLEFAMVRTILLAAVLLVSPHAYGKATTDNTPPAPVADTQPDDAGPTATTKAWIAAGIFAAVVAILVAVSVGSPTQTRPLTPQEIKESQERLLDNVSAMNMWSALARREDAAFREEMKLIELRRLRRLNE